MKTFAFNVTFTREDEQHAATYAIGYSVEAQTSEDAEASVRRALSHLTIKKIALFSVTKLYALPTSDADALQKIAKILDGIDIADMTKAERQILDALKSAGQVR